MFLSELTQNEDIWNFYGSLTLNKWKQNLIFWKPLVFHSVKYDLFFLSVWNERKMACFELCSSSVVTQIEDI